MMTTPFTVSESNTPVDDAVHDTYVDDSAPYRCIECGVALFYGGKGRPPVRCEEHKKGSSTSRNGASNSPTSLKVVEENLATFYTVLGGLIAVVDQESGQLIAFRSDALAHSWIEYAKANPKFRKRLETIGKGTGIGGIIVAHATVAIPIAKKHGALKFTQSHRRRTA